MLQSKAVGVSILGNVEEVIASITAATGILMYTQKAELIFGGNPTKDKPHGLPLCWVACGGVLWCPRMVPLDGPRGRDMSYITFANGFMQERYVKSFTQCIYSQFPCSRRLF
jgi:hypothetical protein